jgi:hypothetical protein
MRLLRSSLAALLMAGAAAPALAQSETDSAGPIPVRGNVPALCSGGSLAGGEGAFELGVLIDTSTGFLLPALSAPPKTLTGAFCSSRSSIRVEATPLTAQNALVAPAGFSRTVNYTATASGWTVAPAVFTIGAPSNPAAVQQRSTAFTGDITVAVGGFLTAGGDSLRMVADPAYQGQVTVTLAVVD